MDQRIKRLEDLNREQTVILTDLRDMMVSARGSWRTIMAVSGAAATIGGLVVKFGISVFPK